MKIAFAAFLTIFAFLWLLGILALYGDSFMTLNHAILYSLVCGAMILWGGYIIYSYNRK
jgi:hypothetical protein